jgi:hypothetical protein
MKARAEGRSSYTCWEDRLPGLIKISRILRLGPLDVNLETNWENACVVLGLVTGLGSLGGWELL